MKIAHKMWSKCVCGANIYFMIIRYGFYWIQLYCIQLSWLNDFIEVTLQKRTYINVAGTPWNWTSKIEFQPESIMEFVFFCFVITIGIQFSGGCVCENWLFLFICLFSIYLLLLKKDYDIAVKSIENCAGDQQVIKIDTNSSVSLNANCELFLKMCFQTNGFETAQVFLKFGVNKSRTERNWEKIKSYFPFLTDWRVHRFIE